MARFRIPGALNGSGEAVPPEATSNRLGILPCADLHSSYSTPRHDNAKSQHRALWPQVKPLDLTISHVTERVNDMFVGVEWDVSFELHKRASRSGHFIQKVTAVLDGELLDPCPYFEAWPVAKHHRTPDYKKLRRELLKIRRSASPGQGISAASATKSGNDDSGGDDHFGYECGLRTSGKYEEEGTVMFYEGPLPTFKLDEIQPAGGLYSTTTQPAFWSGRGVKRRLTVEWQLKGKSETWRVRADARIYGRSGALIHHDSITKNDFSSVLEFIKTKILGF